MSLRDPWILLPDYSSDFSLFLNMYSLYLGDIYEDCFPRSIIIILATMMNSYLLLIATGLSMFHDTKLFNQKVKDCLTLVELAISVEAGCWWLFLLLVAVLTAPLQLSSPVKDFVCGIMTTIPTVIATLSDAMALSSAMVAKTKEKCILIILTTTIVYLVPILLMYYLLV